MALAPHYPFDGAPGPGETWEVAPGLWWVRMPLPFKLNHVNLWLLSDGQGWTLIDTGISNEEIKACWELIEKKFVSAERPIKRLICTHYHPDHMGLAGWFCERHGVELTTTIDEWMSARLYFLETKRSKTSQMLPFFKLAGFSDEQLKLVVPRSTQYSSVADMPPHSFNRVRNRDRIMIDGMAWDIMITEGHSVEQICLFCAEKNVLISSDQILPRITPNISLQPHEPEGDPLKLFLETLEQFRLLPADTLVLPSHNWPFRGLHNRIDSLVAHHHERLQFVMEVCAQPSSGIDVLKKCFQGNLITIKYSSPLVKCLPILIDLCTKVRLNGGSPRMVCIFTKSQN